MVKFNNRGLFILAVCALFFVVASPKMAQAQENTVNPNVKKAQDAVVAAEAQYTAAVAKSADADNRLNNALLIFERQRRDNFQLYGEDERKYSADYFAAKSNYENARAVAAAATTAVNTASTTVKGAKASLAGLINSINASNAAAVDAGTSVEGLKSDAFSRLNPARINNPAGLVNRAIQGLMAFIGSISLVLYIYSGFLWMTASGSSEQVGKAKSILVWTTLGVVVMLSSYMLASFLFKSLGL